ncbi:MAG: hypothetical protein OXQ92_05800 [Boseongicola sp.]|nr:hypothetical protein [Boseongicola sp.]MDD9977145.1 hypothetical protein [Boseongicola sp.]
MSFLEKYHSVLSNISPNSPVRLGLSSSSNTSPVSNPCTPGPTATPQPSKILWEALDDDLSFIGIRVTNTVKEPSRLAAKMASLAIERNIYPVFISWCGDCGLQHYGMQVEQICGANDDECREFEEQLKRLWNLAIIINEDEISAAVG